MDLYQIRKELNMGIPLSSMNLRVTYYSRVSTEHLEQKNSLKNQIDYFEEMIKNNTNWKYIKGYVDDGISGTSVIKRDNFMKMIEDARNNKFDLIITKEISRFSRNTLDSIKYTRELFNYGVFVLFINDNINTILPDSELRLTIMASMAQDEIRRLSERIKFGMNRAIKNGKILGNDMLYGYKKDKINESLIIIDEEADTVKRIFELYVIDNYSINKICNILNSEGIKTRSNKKWCISTISRMIKNPKYKGYYCSKKTEIIDYMTKKVKNNPRSEWVIYKDNKIPPIIPIELWEKANDKLNKMSIKFGRDYKNNKIIYQNRYPLSARIYCLEHNCVFHRRMQCNNEVSWICARFLIEGKNDCDCINIRENEIMSILDDQLKLFGIDLYRVVDVLTSLYGNKSLEKDIKIELSSDKVKSKLIELLIKRIDVSKKDNNREKINLKILWNLKNHNYEKYYEFKRGYNTISTRRYIVSYYVESFFMD